MDLNEIFRNSVDESEILDMLGGSLFTIKQVFKERSKKFNCETERYQIDFDNIRTLSYDNVIQVLDQTFSDLDIILN